MDPRNRVITGFSSLYITLSTKNRPPYFFRWSVFYYFFIVFLYKAGILILLYDLCSHYLSFLSYFTNAYSRSKYVCSSLSAVISQSGPHPGLGNTHPLHMQNRFLSHELYHSTEASVCKYCLRRYSTHPLPDISPLPSVLPRCCERSPHLLPDNPGCW